MQPANLEGFYINPPTIQLKVLFFFLKLYSLEMQSGRVRKREVEVPIHWLTPQIPVTFRAGPSRNQEHHLILPDIREPKYMSYYLLLHT